MAPRLGVFDPSGRLLDELGPVIERARAELELYDPTSGLDGFAGILVPPSHATELGPMLDGGPARWIVGDANSAARVAGAAASAHAAGVLISPVAPETLDAITQVEASSPDADLARSRRLIALSLVDLTGAAAETLRAIAEGFSAHDCIVWWKDGAHMVPTSARPSPNEAYRTQIATAARIAAASSGTVIAGDAPRSVIADALRPSPTEIAGLVAIVCDSGRRFSVAERTDLKAIAARLTRELSWLTSHRRIVAEGERLLAASLHDPLSGAMSRGAFEQTITHEVAAAGRRKETLTLALFDVVGLRRINLAHGHKTGDEVLAQCAGRLRASVRGNDPMGRPGGDELAVLLVGTDIEQAQGVAKKILDKIQNEPIDVEGSPIPVQLRVVITEIGAGERSGEAALSRCYSALRTAPIGEVRVASARDRVPGDSEASADTGALNAGTILGGTYRVVHELSRGAMGVVYRGEDLGLGRPVAIKVLRSDLASDRDLVDRFRAEAGILAALHHKNLVQVYALGEHQGEVYFVMELVEGQPLSEVLRATLERREWFPLEAVAQIALEIGDALDAMHAHGLIHRDVKPANILLDRERDRAVLVDVGVAMKAGDAGEAAGTPGFAAPESFLEQEGGPSTDVYGLAATMYCAITGRPPFGSGAAPAVVHRQLHDPLPPPSQMRPNIAHAVDAVIAKALTPQPRKRWASASTFALALGRALERGSGAIVVPPTEPPADVAAAAARAVMQPTEALGTTDLASVHSLRLSQPIGVVNAIAGHVRAAHLRVLSKLLQHHVGESGMAKARNERPDLSRVLGPTLAPLGWVELGELVAALGYSRTLLPTANIARKVGRGVMSATFARLFGADPTSVQAETVLAALATFWPRYHDWCTAAANVDQGAAAIAIEGYPGSRDVCALVAAQLERVVELTGATDVASVHPTCRCEGGDRCEYQVTWTTRPIGPA